MSERPLWAPWRLEYVTGPKPGECIFCAAASAGDDGEARGDVLHAPERVSLRARHLMVAPYRHIGELDDLQRNETVELMELAQRAVAALREVMSPDGFNVGLNLGTVAGAGIADHLHLHVVPRWQGDTNFMPVLSGTSVMPQALDATRDALVQARRRRF